MPIYCESLNDSITYHFISDKKTNEITKPEWFFSYVKEVFENNI